MLAETERASRAAVRCGGAGGSEGHRQEGRQLVDYSGV